MSTIAKASNPTTYLHVRLPKSWVHPSGNKATSRYHVQSPSAWPGPGLQSRLFPLQSLQSSTDILAALRCCSLQFMHIVANEVVNPGAYNASAMHEMLKCAGVLIGGHSAILNLNNVESHTCLPHPCCQGIHNAWSAACSIGPTLSDVD